MHKPIIASGQFSTTSTPSVNCDYSIYIKNGIYYCYLYQSPPNTNSHTVFLNIHSTRVLNEFNLYLQKKHPIPLLQKVIMILTLKNPEYVYVINQYHSLPNQNNNHYELFDNENINGTNITKQEILQKYSDFQHVRNF